MAKRLEIDNGQFKITDTVSLVVEFSHLAEETFNLISNDRIFFYYDLKAYEENYGDVDKIRSRGYAIADLEDATGNSFSDFDEVLEWLDGTTGSYANIFNKIEDYIASFEADSYIYSGFHINTIPMIKRTKDSVEEIAQGVTDLVTDWGNRLTLTYV